MLSGGSVHESPVRAKRAGARIDLGVQLSGRNIPGV
jgi:hypothetical protein